MSVAPPTSSVRGLRGAVASADQFATNAGIGVLADGGNAVDAAIATNAMMAVVGPSLCGVGGDLFALVHDGGRTHALNASGRAGSGADPDRLRDEGWTEMPFRHDVRCVTVPGCVDGWLALHARFGSLAFDRLLAPAIALADGGFPAGPLFVASARQLDQTAAERMPELAAARRIGVPIRRPGLARALRAVAAHGRAGFYAGEFGSGLLELGGGLFTEEDLDHPLADWVAPLTAPAFDLDLHTIPPNSQGYLTLGAAGLAAQLELPDDPDDPHWAHLLIECATAAAFDRPIVLHQAADGKALLAAIAARAGLVDPHRASARSAPGADGDTTYLCAIDGDGMGVSLIQSNAAGFGSWLAEPNTGVNLHNRGIGFNLTPGHPAEFGPGRRPPHTLSPALATAGSELVCVFGTMGGDAQPQILLQLATRLFRHHHSPDRSVRAGRWALRGPTTGFDTWTSGSGPVVQVEGHAPAGWVAELARRGHRVEGVGAYDSSFGHAHAIVRGADGVLAGAADPRTVLGSCAAI